MTLIGKVCWGHIIANIGVSDGMMPDPGRHAVLGILLIRHARHRSWLCYLWPAPLSRFTGGGGANRGHPHSHEAAAVMVAHAQYST